MSDDQHTRQDPVEQYPQPNFPEQQLEHPGLESEMQPAPDYGEATYRGTGKLEGKVAVITGGDSGIGRAVALAFAREGADVVISYLEAEESDAQETVRVVEDAGKRAVTVPGDIGVEEQCRTIIQKTMDEFGKIDILVNNAAYQMARGGIADISSWEFDHTFKTNIYSTFYLSKMALEHMEPGATIINTCSVEGYQPAPALLAYAATKGAIVTFTKGLAMETISRGIRVNVVAPGPVWAPLIPATLASETVSSFGGQSPIGRPAQPAEFGPVYVFLASQESSYINGETLGVTGGMPLP